jgi:four helix bundle protein
MLVGANSADVCRCGRLSATTRPAGALVVSRLRGGTAQFNLAFAPHRAITAHGLRDRGYFRGIPDVRSGTRRALSGFMAPARHYSQLTVWKLAEEVRLEVFRLTAKPHFAADLRAKSQADDATNSVCRNIAEGFGCETHAEFARFLEIARRSLNELHDILHGAQLKQYVTTAELAAIRRLSHRLYPAFSRFIAYLRRTPSARPRRGTPDSVKDSIK